MIVRHWVLWYCFGVWLIISLHCSLVFISRRNFIIGFFSRLYVWFLWMLCPFLWQTVLFFKDAGFLETDASDLIVFSSYFKQNSPTRQHLNVICFVFYSLHTDLLCKVCLMWKFLLDRLEEQDFDFEQKPITDTLEKAQSAETGFEGSWCFPFWCQFVSLLLIWHSAIMYWFCCRLEKCLWQFLCCFFILMCYIHVERLSGLGRCSLLKKKEWIVTIWGREGFRLQWLEGKIKGNEGLRAQTPWNRHKFPEEE